MRVIVVIGRVLDPAGIVVHRGRGRIFVNQEEYVIQPADRGALEAALRIKETAGAEVVVLPRGLLPDDDVLRQAVATGADRAIYLTGEAEEPDEAMMAGVLAEAVECLEGADLILLGSTTWDTGQSQLGPRLAEALDWPQIVGVWEVETEDGTAQVVRREKGEYISLDVDLPALISVLPGALKLRYPDGVRLINVYKEEGEMADAVEQWDVADLVEEAARAPLMEKRGRDFPSERERGVRVSGGLEDMAQSAAEALRERLRR